ncbi:MAG TPA: hypothetical protein VMG99_08910 [Thermoplasmata archaeon]|nr:hypothetical protein [Thermoplasmata archaeon]
MAGGSGIGWAVAAGAAALAIGAGVVYALKSGGSGPTGSSCPAGDLVEPSGGCPAGYTIDAVNAGCCAPGVPGTETCTEDAQCGACESCVGGLCGAPVPANVDVLVNDGGSQDETVASVGIPFTNLSTCDWSSLAFYEGQKQFTVSGRLVDATGAGVPCTAMNARFESTALGVLDVTGTDANGNFTVTYEVAAPYQGNAGCPGPGDTVPVAIVANLDFLLPNGALVGTTVCTVTVYITGV